MAFRNYEKMLDELSWATYDNPATQLKIEELCGEDNLSEEDLNEIVRLYNIHCIPNYKNR